MFNIKKSQKLRKWFLPVCLSFILLSIVLVDHSWFFICPREPLVSNPLCVTEFYPILKEEPCLDAFSSTSTNSISNLSTPSSLSYHDTACLPPFLHSLTHPSIHPQKVQTVCMDSFPSHFNEGCVLSPMLSGVYSIPHFPLELPYLSASLGSQVSLRVQVCPMDLPLGIFERYLRNG